MPDAYVLGGHERAIARCLSSLAASKIIPRLFQGDPAPWGRGRAERRLVRNRLGWIRSPERMLREVPRLETFAREAREDGLRHVVLLGMGGSSLCVEVFRRLFPPRAGHPEILILDSTVPAAVRRVETRCDIARTLFVVSSKSGTTAETLALLAYFWTKARRLRGRLASRHFVAITDAGTPLAHLAASCGYRTTFHNAADIGGRYSALSYFGLVPAALGGADVAAILRRAIDALERCGPTAPPSENPGLRLGAALGTLARRRRDKVVLLIDRGLRPYGLWIEQLLAESTGKEGRGIIPVEAPDAPAPGRACLSGADRVAVAIALEGGRDADGLERRARAAGGPSIVLGLRDRLDIGASMLQWEIATAVAGAVLGVNPFDEPNVSESKKNTESALAEFDATGRMREEAPSIVDGRARVFLASAAAGDRPGGAGARPWRGSLRPALRSLLGLARPGDYLAVLAYVDPEDARAARCLEAIRALLLARGRLATTFGYGPRYLHSTGQLHKGGPNTGLFVQIVPDDPLVLPVPTKPYDFETLKQAQALGDYRSLKRRGRRILRVRFGGGAGAALRAVLAALRSGRRRDAGGRRASPTGRRKAGRPRRVRA